MPAGPPKDNYTRTEALRLVGISDRQLRGWEAQELIPHLKEYAFSDLIALRSLEKLRRARVPSLRIRRAVRALREKLGGVEDPLKELKIFCEGRKVAVLVEGQKMEPVSGQLLLDFDRAELKSLLSFPRGREPVKGDSVPQPKRREAEQWFEKGLELERVGAPLPDVMEAYNRALTLDPRSAGALLNLGTIHYHRRAWTEAESCYKQALEIDPQYALAHFNLGNLFDEKGERQQAMLHYQAALRIDPNYADAHYNVALLYQTQGDALKALRHWKTYLKLDPGSSWAAVARREMEKLRRAVVLGGSQEGRSQEGRSQESGVRSQNGGEVG